MLEPCRKVEIPPPIELLPSPPDLDCEKDSCRGELAKLAVDEDDEAVARHQDDAAFRWGYDTELLVSEIPGEKAEFRLPAFLPLAAPLGVMGCKSSFNAALDGGEFSSADRLARLFERASVF